MQKKYGQNFLTSAQIPAKIAAGCTDLDLPEVSESQDPKELLPYEKRADSLIFEIGPGAGILTKELAKRFKKVLAVEIDEELIPVLKDSLAGYENITVINRDIMKVELAPILEEHRQTAGGSGKLPVSVCANLPYYITTPVLMKLLEEYGEFSFITVMVQKEVARRLCAKPGSDDYGAITAAIGLYGSASKLFDVSAGNFNPKPKVDSSVVQISLFSPAKYTKKQIEAASKVIKAAFSMRRKTLVNTLCGLSCACACADRFNGKEALASLVGEMFGNKNIRGEELSTEQFVALSEKLFG